MPSFNDRPTEAPGQTDTNTRAYNANEVAQVYMSFDRNDLLGPEIQNQAGSKQLEPGFYAMSDPLGMRSALERFEVDFAYGSNTSTYKIRLLNPTTELEFHFAQFFGQVYPTEHGVVQGWVDDKTRQDYLNGVTGDTDDYYTDTGQASRNVVPTVYIRWGYGTQENNGLSQIHKCRISDVRYQINAKQDKVVELMLVDLLTFTRTSNIYNKREHIATVPWKDLNASGGKKASTMLMEVLGGFATVYPELQIVSDLTAPEGNGASFAEKVDGHFEMLAASLAKTAQQKAESAFSQGRQVLLGDAFRAGAPRTIGSDDAKALVGVIDTAVPDREGWRQVYERLKEDPEALKNFEEQLNAPMATMIEWDKERLKTGAVSGAIRLQAFKIFFEQLGLHWEVNTNSNLKVFDNGITSPKQLDDGIVSYEDALDRAHENADEALKINLFDYVRLDGQKPQIPFSPDHGGNVNADERLSFWPPILDFVEAPEVSQKPIAGVTNIDIYGSGTAVNRFNFGTKGPGYGGNGVQVIENAVVVTFDEVMLDNVVQYIGREQGGGFNDLFLSATPVKFFNVNGTVELNSAPDVGEGGASYYLFNPNTLPPGGTTSGNPSNTAFLLPRYPEGYESALNDIMTADSPGRLTPFEVSPDAKVYPPSTEQKSPPRDAPRELRPMSSQEKTAALNASIAPIWLNPGPVNTALNRQKEPFRHDPQSGQLEYYQSWREDYTFSYSDLLRMFPTSVTNSLEDGEPISIPPILCEVRTPYQFDMSKYDEDTLQSTRTYMPYYNPSRVSNVKSRNCLGLLPGTETEKTVLKRFPPPTDKSFHPTTYPVIDKEKMELLDFSNSSLMASENEFTSWRATYCPEWEKHVDASFHAIYPDEWDYGMGYGDSVRESGSLDNWQRIENQKLYLEPTVETWEYLSLIPTKLAATAAAEEPEVFSGLTVPPPIVPKEVKLKDEPVINGFVSLGTDGDAPNISVSLDKVVNGLNSFLADSASKIQIIILDLSRLTVEQRDEFVEDETLLPGFEVKEKQELVDKNKTILFIATDDTINNWSSRFINPVYSFPELNTGNAGEEGIIYLDYATKDSIITDLTFEGEYRWLLGISQAVFMNRYFGSINEYFDTGALQGRLVNRFLGRELQARISRLRDNPDDVTEQGFTLAASEELYERYNSRPNQIESNLYIDSDVLALLPGLVAYYSFGQLSKLVGHENAKDLTIISSLVNDDFTLKLLFPEMKFNSGTNEAESIMAVGGAKKNWAGTILTRRVDFQTSYMRLGEDNQRELQRKIMDTNFFFTEAMKQTMWQVELETLGIPELDNPIVEFTQRDIILRVYDSRLSTNTPHWLSGAYRMNGISHTLSPSEGYKTKLRLYRSDSNKLTNLMHGKEVSRA